MTAPTRPTVTFSARYDNIAHTWRVRNDATGDYLTDDNGKPLSWACFNNAYDIARRTEPVANG